MVEGELACSGGVVPRLERDWLDRPVRLASLVGLLSANRKGKFGAPRYDIRDLGVSVAEVRERFKFYYDAYDIPRE
jgi:hypothetical protein